jgi:transcriptional regulator with XRE-family HTH domain
MRLSDKIRYLREVEGQLRGLGRAMTQGELVRAIAEEMEASLSQSYLSQIESGARPHLTNTTRLLLSKFFKVHPGYLVDDPEGYNVELLSELRAETTLDEKLDLWLIGGAERFRRDAELRRALLAIAEHEDSRRCLLLLESILETPALIERLLELLRPEKAKTVALPKLVSMDEARPAAQAAKVQRGSGSKSGDGGGGAGRNGSGSGTNRSNNGSKRSGGARR